MEHPDALSTRLSSAQLTEWLAYYHEEPFGQDRLDAPLAIGHALLANINRDAHKRPEPFRAEEFMPYARREPEKPKRLWARLVQTFGRIGVKPHD